jgi:four helix bundle protein
MPLKTYRELEAWKKGIELVEAIYLLCKTMPAEERFGLISQIQRAAVSIPANIAEGYGRTHRGEYVHHLSIARGSLMELETHLTVIVRLGMVTREQATIAWSLCQEVGKLLGGLIASLQRPPMPKP